MAAERSDWESRITNIAHILIDRDIYIFSINEPAVWPIDNIAFFRTTGHNKKHEEFAGTLLPMLGSIPQDGPFKNPNYKLINDKQGQEPNFIIKFSSVVEFKHNTEQHPRWQCDIYKAYFKTLHTEAFDILNLSGGDIRILSEHEITICTLMISEIRRLDTLFSYFLFDWQLKISIRASGGFWHNELGQKFIEWYRTTNHIIDAPILLNSVLTNVNKHSTILYTLLDAYNAQITDEVFGNLLELTSGGFFVELNYALRTQIFTGQSRIDQQKDAIRRIKERQQEREQREQRERERREQAQEREQEREQRELEQEQAQEREQRELEQAQKRSRRKRSASAASLKPRQSINGGKYTKKNKQSKRYRNKKSKKSKRYKLKKM